MSRIGLGLDFQHLNSYGISFEALLAACGYDLSHLSIVALTTPHEARAFRELAGNLPVIHHFTGVAPAGVSGVNLHHLENEARLSQILGARWGVEDIGIWNIGPYCIPYFAPPVLCQETLDQTVGGILRMQEKLDFEFLPEVPSCSFICGDMCLGEFFSRLVERTDCGIVLDISHVYSYALYTNQPAEQVLQSFPLKAVREFHVAGGSIHPVHGWRYRDTHNEPVPPPILVLLAEALKRCTGLRAVTYEIGVGMPIEQLSTEFDQLNRICKLANFQPVLN